MKVHITGPRSSLDEDLKLPWLRLDLDLEALPREGEHVTLNSGTGYTVVRRMWWVKGPENDAYWARGDYEEDGEFEAVHLDVEPDGYRKETYTMDGARREGYVKGRADAVRELRVRLEGLRRAGISQGEYQITAVLAWLAEQDEPAA